MQVVFHLEWPATYSVSALCQCAVSVNCVSAGGMCVDIRSKCADNHLGSGQETFRKEIERDRLRT